MSERKLASVRRVNNIRPIEGADKIEVVSVDGWDVVCQKGKHEVGDKVVYFEIDSFLPEREEFEFLRKSSFKQTSNLGNGFRLKTIKLRKQVSQGLVMSLEELGVDPGTPEGWDLTEALGVQKWEVPIPANLRGEIHGYLPEWIPRTDEPRIQNLDLEAIRHLTFESTLKLDGCFGYKTYIPTWDGKSVLIGDIVTKGLRPTLIGKDESGNLVPCEITNVFNNGTKDYWMDIYFEVRKRSNFAGKSGKIRTTPNHKVFLSSGEEISASDLKIGSELVTYDVAPHNSVIHFIKSSLLGDGSLPTKHGKYPTFSEGHKSDHEEFVDYITNCLGKCAGSDRWITSGFGTKMKIIKSKRYLALDEMRAEWYPNGTKVVPENLDWIDDFSVAKWYMDDGSLSHSDYQNDRAVFSTNGFVRSDVERLAKKLEEMYGVNTSIQDSKGSSIRINYSNGSIESFWKAIAPHIHPVMRYKLHERYRDVEFTPYVKGVEVKVPQVTKVTKLASVMPGKFNFPHGRVGFDIETTTHNYMCGGILVHNSSMTVYIHPQDGNLGVCSRNLDLKVNEANMQSNTFVKTAMTLSLGWKLREAKDMTGSNLAFQGELVGPGIQGNPCGLTEYKFYIFDIWDIDNQRYMSSMFRRSLCADLDLDHVPVLNTNQQINHLTKKNLLEMADELPSPFIEGDLNIKTPEGIVFKANDASDSFKVISNKFLLKER